jgi:hypothetical protein
MDDLVLAVGVGGIGEVDMMEGGREEEEMDEWMERWRE